MCSVARFETTPTIKSILIERLPSFTSRIPNELKRAAASTSSQICIPESLKRRRQIKGSAVFTDLQQIFCDTRTIVSRDATVAWRRKWKQSSGDRRLAKLQPLAVTADAKKASALWGLEPRSPAFLRRALPSTPPVSPLTGLRRN